MSFPSFPPEPVSEPPVTPFPDDELPKDALPDEPVFPGNVQDEGDAGPSGSRAGSAA